MPRHELNCRKQEASQRQRRRPLRVSPSSAVNFHSSPVSQFTFPDGRAIDIAYDLLYRRTDIEEVSTSTSIAAWKFVGPSRVAEILLGKESCRVTRAVLM